MSACIVFTFATTHDALEAEAAFERSAIEVEPIPTPAVSGTRCGIAMQVRLEDREAASACLSEAAIEPVDILELDCT